MAKRLRNVRRGLMISTAALLATQFPTIPVAHAQQTGEVSLEEIVVTARKKEENLFQAPLSITSLSATDIEDNHIRDVSELMNYTPGFYFQAQATFSSAREGTPALRFRGMNNSSNDPLQQQGGMFIDGVFLFGGIESLTMDDVERIEVIKGPQSALFGRSTFSGAINFITKQPADHFVAEASAGVETRGSYDISGSVEGPLITDKLDMRVSGSVIEKGAHFHADDGGAIGEEHTNVVNAQLVFKPSDNLTFRVRQTGTWLDDSRDAVVNMNASNPLLAGAANRCQTGSMPFWCGAVPLVGSPGVPFSAISVSTALVSPAFAASNNPNLVKDILNNNTSNALVTGVGLPYINDVPHLDHVGLAGNFQRTSFEGKYDFANGMSYDATYVYSRMASLEAANSSYDAGNGYIISPNILVDSSFDTRLSSDQKQRLTWMVGANYFLETSLGGPSGTGSIASANGVTHLVSYSQVANFSNQDRNFYYGGFGALHYDITQQLGADFEGRYQAERVTTSYQLASQTTIDFKSFVPRAILTYKPNQELTVYASYSKGELPGTSNSNTALLFPALQAQILAYPGYSATVPAETIQSFELGIKQQTSRWRYALTGYYMKWDNFKDSVAVVCPNNQCGPTTFGTNATTVIPEDARIWGVESEIGVVLTKHWDVNASFDYVHGRYVHEFQPLDLPDTGTTNADGKTIFQFPVAQGTASSTYRGELSGTWGWFVRGDVNYTGRIYLDEVNQSWIGSSWKVNAHTGVEHDKMRFELYVDNLTDDKHWLSGTRGTQSNYTLSAAPISQATISAVLPRLRTFGARVKVQFD